MTATSRTWPAWSTTVHVAVTDPRALDAACLVVRDEMARTARAADRFDPHLRALRGERRGRDAPSPSPPTFVRLLRAALDAAEATGGLVDPTLGAQLRAAGYDRDIAEVRRQPGRAAATATRHQDAWQQVALTDAQVRVPAGVLLDLGATAKALTADLAAARAARRTGSNVLVSLGGDIAVAGRQVAGAGRRAPGRDDDGPYVELATGGLATSTTLARAWTVDGRPAHHLIDPRTGAPADGPWRTATVAAASALDANVASTAAVILGASAEAWLAARRLPARLVAHDGTVRTVAGWPAEEAA